MKMKSIIISVPAEVHKEFKTVATIKGLTMTEILTERIKEVLDKEKKEGVLKK